MKKGLKSRLAVHLICTKCKEKTKQINRAKGGAVAISKGLAGEKQEVSSARYQSQERDNMEKRALQGSKPEAEPQPQGRANAIVQNKSRSNQNKVNEPKLD